MGFTERVQQAVLLFRERALQGPLLVVGNLDTDGITATSLLVQALMREQLTFSVQIIKQLNDHYLDELRDCPYPTILFTDLGSGYINGIEQKLQGKNIFILDHHYPEKRDVADWIVHVNPHLDGIDGTKDVSAAGVSYFFIRALRPQNKDLAHLALVGAVGDIQEYMGFRGLNREILKDALDIGLLEVKEGLRMFGAYTRPLHKVLEYSTNPYLPGVTGNRAGSIRFLEEHGFAKKGMGETLRLSNLHQEDVDRLLSLLHQQGGDAVGPVYLLNGVHEHYPLRDLKEFSTLLNACGRMGKASLGVGVCLQDQLSRKKAFEILDDYRREIMQGLEWFYRHRNSEHIIEKKGFVIINADGNIRDSIIGTLASLVSKSNLYPEHTIIMSMARTLDDDIKVSMRLSGFKSRDDIDLRVLLKNILEKTGGYGGGHRLAAGGTVPPDKEKALIETALDVLGRAVVEQRVV